MLVGIFFVNNFNAQTTVCNLQIDVFEFNNGFRLRDYNIENVNAILTDLATEKTVKSGEVAKTPLFNNLTAGNYRIEIIKNGYQRRIKEFELLCNNIESIQTISKPLFLQKGDSKEITKFEAKSFTVKDDNSQDKFESSKSIVNSKSRSLVSPNYPAAARAVRASGAVNVQVTIDEDGEIIMANAVSGHPLLRQAAEKAAKESRFSPTFLAGQPVKVTGIILYNFVP